MNNSIIKGLQCAQYTTEKKINFATRTKILASYRSFLRAGVAAVNLKNKKHIKSLVRKGFENKDYLVDPEIELKAKNTLELLRLSSERRGMEHTLINNLCQLHYLTSKDDIRPPFYNRKFPPQVKQLHETSTQDLQLVIQMLNKDLKLLL